MSLSSDPEILGALLSCIQPGQGGIPLNVQVTVTPSDEVLDLRRQITELKEEKLDLKARLDRCEYLLMCQHGINDQLRQLLINNGIKIPRHFDQFREDNPKPKRKR